MFFFDTKHQMSHTTSSIQKEMTHGNRKNRFCPTHRLSSQVRISKMRPTLQGNYKVQSFSCWDQFLCMAFAQLTYRESLRDIEACLRSAATKLYHMGFRGKVSRNTLAHANEDRDWRIYADFAQMLIATARPLYADDYFGVELKQTVYALDSTTIDLCLSLFPWAKFRKHKGAVKLHTLLDLRGNIPTVILITDGKVHDVKILDELFSKPGAIYVMDRGYLDFARLLPLHRKPRLSSSPAPKAISTFNVSIRIRSTKPPACSAIRPSLLNGFDSAKDYPDQLRRIRFYDAEKTNGWSF